MSVALDFSNDGRFVRHKFLSLSPTSTTIFERSFDMLLGRYYVPMRVREVVDELSGEITEIKEKIQPPTFLQHKGELSVKARRSLNRSVYTMLQMIDEKILLEPTHELKQKFTFATLTLASSQIKSINQDSIDYYATDKEIKAKCFNQLMTELRTDKGVDNYVWVAEKQKNGSIHFHILLDRKIDYMWLRTRWNSIQNKFGFVDRYAESMRKLTYKQYKELRSKDFQKLDETSLDKIKKAWEFGKKTDWLNPNSTDIETLRHVDNVAGYISKYMSKSYGHNSEIQRAHVSKLAGVQEINELVAKAFYTIEGRMWQCSQNISKCRKNIIECEDYHEQEIIKLKKVVGDEKVFTDDRFITILHNVKQLFSHANSIYSDYVSSVKNKLNYILNQRVSSNIISCVDSLFPSVLAQALHRETNEQTFISFT